MNNKVKFLRGTSGEYAVAEKDSDTIYFTTDDGKLYIGDKEISGDGGLTIDDTLSDTSTNPVQNKVVKRAIDKKADKSLYGDTTINVGRKAGTDVGHFSTAEGQATTASSLCSHAEGDQTTASGNFSHSEGEQTKAIGAYSHAEGCRTEANGGASHAEGRETTAFGDYSHTSGYYTKALHDNEAAYGKYNVSNDNTLFSIGDGTADDARHNAFEITKTGGKLHDKDIATTDLIPTSLPANGGNADTVDGLHADSFRHITKNTLNSLPIQPTGEGDYFVINDTGEFPYSWGYLSIRYGSSTTEFVATFQTTGYDNKMYINTHRGGWQGWKEISTTPIKSTGRITTPTNEYGKIVLPNSDSRMYISVTVAGCYNQMYMDNDNYVFCVTDGNFAPQVNTAISYIAYYIE